MLPMYLSQSGGGRSETEVINTRYLKTSSGSKSSLNGICLASTWGMNRRHHPRTIGIGLVNRVVCQRLMD